MNALHGSARPPGTFGHRAGAPSQPHDSSVIRSRRCARPAPPSPPDAHVFEDRLQIASGEGRIETRVRRGADIDQVPHLVRTEQRQHIIQLAIAVSKREQGTRHHATVPSAPDRPPRLRRRPASGSARSRNHDSRRRHQRVACAPSSFAHVTRLNANRWYMEHRFGCQRRGPTRNGQMRLLRCECLPDRAYSTSRIRSDGLLVGFLLRDGPRWEYHGVELESP